MILMTRLQNETLEEISRSFRAYSQSQGSMMLFVGLVVAAGAASALVYAVLSGRERMIGRRTFYRLARASGLTRNETSLLVTVSRRVLPDNPPEIFVRRSLFENAVVDVRADAAIVTSVRKKVYGP
ncbi:MAG TPA: hypothetical protein VKW04_04495 [Planctomycetota bacterium]|nr:hypothetical protein [Planctomycetota bacterium]